MRVACCALVAVSVAGVCLFGWLIRLPVPVCLLFRARAHVPVSSGSALPWPEEIGAEVQALADQAAAKQAKVDETRKAREAEALKGIEIPAQSI